MTLKSKLLMGIGCELAADVIVLHFHNLSFPAICHTRAQFG
jgi:hypothetical protein